MPHNTSLIEANEILSDVGCKVGRALEVTGEGQGTQHRVGSLRGFANIVFE